MTDFSTIDELELVPCRRVEAVDGQALRREAKLWIGLAIAALAVAGIFALMLALSRVPGIERVVAWPLGFFAKGLVIHVVFSLVVWFLAVFALLTTIATAEMETVGDPPLSWLGTVGTSLVTASFPLLFLPAFLDDSVASLNNYIPVIEHPSYYLGLGVLFAGTLCPVIRLTGSVIAVRQVGSPLAFAMTAGALIYTTILLCFAIALWLSTKNNDVHRFYEHLFWGGGHVMQFLNTLLLLVGWFMLARETLGEKSIGAGTLRRAVGVLASAALAAPVIYGVFPAFSPLQQEAFRLLQFVLGLPTLLIAISVLAAAITARRRGGLPWHDPAFLALTLSSAVFGAGGIIGFLIDGADTRTPAHYHGMIAGVNLACMGMILRIILPRLKSTPRPGNHLRWQILMFGFGQLAACVGLFWAGGYGAPRKVAAGASRLLDSAAAGMYLNGVGALVAVIGGIIFVYTVLSALRPTAGISDTAHASAR
jgi:hypothetical protein